MKRSQDTATHWTVAVLGALLLTAAGAQGAVPVEESVPVGRGAPSPSPGAQSAPSTPRPAPAQPAGGAAAGGDASRLTELFYQLQVLQQEVQELRGLVEAQSHQINRLARDQQEQYLDLDRRMQALRGNTQAAPVASGAPALDLPAPAGGAAAGEREAYSAAFELMRQRQFRESLSGFRNVVETYPNGAMTANAFYWIGELHLALDEFEPARQAFAQVVNLYPDHQKVPDAIYKLGVVHHRLGDVGRAREFLNRVRTQHPQTSAAGLAQTYLSEL